MLRAYQLDIVGRILKSFRSSRSVLVQMPTGTGKTLVLAETVCRMGEKERKKGTVLIVAHRRELVEQIRETACRMGIDRLTDMEVRSVQWLSRNMDQEGFEPSLVVIDEAHHALAATYRTMWEAWPAARFLGLTATPCRLDGRGLSALFDTLVQSWSIGRFIQEGWLSAFDYYGIRPDSEEQRLVDSLGRRGADGDYQTKEMTAVLDHRPGIERLYDSVRRYAEGRKGIVYAVSISHARHIAGYYSGHGLHAVAIDSETPSGIRRQHVADFREGRIKVLVNVDLFSEGFDCPDVEFVQLARPTLSLSKYLQMAGRGLRRTAGKQCCVMIDNVGLYRVFGLPAADRDWPAMFKGRLPGRACMAEPFHSACSPMSSGMDTCVCTDDSLEEVVSHERLLSLIADGSLSAPERATDVRLRAYRDRESGLYGLKRGERVTVFPQYPEVFDVTDTMAAVRFRDGQCGILGADGTVRMKLPRRSGLRFLGDDLLSATDMEGRRTYIDLRNGLQYRHRPVPMCIGRVDMLCSGGKYYSRTGRPLKEGFDRERCLFTDKGFYLSVVPRHDGEWFRVFSGLHRRYGFRAVCLLADDDTDVYGLTEQLGDGSIIVTDREGNRYHVEADGKKHPLDNVRTADGMIEADDRLVQVRKRADARRQSVRKRHRESTQPLLRQAVPFRSGNRWGLKLGDRVIVPPIYRSIQSPVGNYRVVEKNPCQWGIICLDGRVIVDMCYMEVKLRENGTASLTRCPGNTKTVKLGR